MLDIIIGNISSIGAMICDSYSGTRRTRKSMLTVQIFSQVFYIISSVVLQAYSATVQNAVTIFRNLVAMKDEPSKKMAIFLTALPVVLGFVFNNLGWWGVLPIAANLQYSIAVFKFHDNPRAIKVSLIINSAMFCVFNFYVLNFVSGVACFVIIITTAISLSAEKKEKANTKE